MTKWLVSCSLGVGIVVQVTCAVAQATTDMDSARALFDDARLLMKTARYDEACPKLEAVKEIYAGPGVLLNLGDCYEKTGRTASAWAAFNDARSTAAAEGRGEHEAEARRRGAALTAPAAGPQPDLYDHM